MTARAPYDVVVVGLGLAGLVAGLAAASRGASVLVAGKGYGTLRFRTGTIDVLGALLVEPRSPTWAVLVESVILADSILSRRVLSFACAATARLFSSRSLGEPEVLSAIC